MPALSFAVKYQRMQIPSRWHIKHHHRERQLPIFIIAVVEHEPEARLVFVTGALPFEVRMLPAMPRQQGIRSYDAGEAQEPFSADGLTLKG